MNRLWKVTNPDRNDAGILRRKEGYRQRPILRSLAHCLLPPRAFFGPDVRVANESCVCPDRDVFDRHAKAYRGACVCRNFRVVGVGSGNRGSRLLVVAEVLSHLR